MPSIRLGELEINAPEMPLASLERSNFFRQVTRLGEESVVVVPTTLRAQGDALDRLAESVYGITRNFGEEDTPFRARILGRAAGTQNLGRSKFYEYDELEITVGGQTFKAPARLKKKSCWEWLREPLPYCTDPER